MVASSGNQAPGVAQMDTQLRFGSCHYIVTSHMKGKTASLMRDLSILLSLAASKDVLKGPVTIGGPPPTLGDCDEHLLGTDEAIIKMFGNYEGF